MMPATSRSKGVVPALLLAVVLTAIAALAAGIWWERKASAPALAALAASQPDAADIGFCQDMAVHHDQAVLMSTLALTHGDLIGKAQATAILLDQSQEIGIMRGWLQLWGKPMLNTAPMAWMHPDDMSGMKDMKSMADMAHGMPGMASSQELLKLWQSSGKAFDILFMQLMIRHHEGGILMARDAAKSAKLDIVRNAARTMAIQQTLEISRMRMLLQADGAEPLPSIL